MTELRYAWRFGRHAWHSDGLRVIALALTVAVAAVTAVGFFTERIERAMDGQAAVLLAADIRLRSADKLDPLYLRQATAEGLRSSRFISFPSVLLTDQDASQLVAVKAVEEDYPLRGSLRVGATAYGPGNTVFSLPSPGTVWIDPRLAGGLQLAVGDTVELGVLRLRVAGFLQEEPDRGGDLFQLAPRVMMNRTDVAATGLATTASRLRHYLLLAGPADAVTSYRTWFLAQDDTDVRLRDARTARPEMRLVLDRIASYLGLAAVVAVLLSGVAVALAAWNFAEQQATSSAILCALGASGAWVLRLFVLQLLALALWSLLLGSAVGFVAQFALSELLSSWFSLQLPWPSPAPLLTALLTVTAILFGFALMPAVGLRHVSVMRVLRSGLVLPRPKWWALLLPALFCLALLVLWQAGQVMLAAIALLSVLGTVLLAGVTALLLWLPCRLVRPGHRAWRWGIVSLARRPSWMLLQLIALGTGLTTIFALLIVQDGLLGSWKDQLPPQTPNQFIINIEPQERAPLMADLAAAGIGDTLLYPMIRARLLRINEHPVRADDYRDERAKRLATRGFYLSWAAAMPTANTIEQGRWWRTDELQQPLFSVEKGLADALGIVLGDRVSFRIGERVVEAPIQSVREVQWDSFSVNFFFLATESLLQSYPATYVTSFFLPDGQPQLIPQLVRRYPGITVFDVRALMRQVRALLDRAVLAIEYVFLFSFLTALLVLYVCVSSGARKRHQDQALLRVLGASNRYLRRAQAVEFALLGVLAGVLAVVLSQLAGWILAERVFDIPFKAHLWSYFVPPLLGGVSTLLAGLWLTRKTLKRSPMAILRG